MSRGGRGRGGRGGVSKSFNREQLQALGVVGNDVLPGPVTQPPPLYPLLDRKPVSLTSSLETDYLLILKQDFIDHMQLSPSYLKMPVDPNKQPEQEIDKLVAQLPSVKEKYNWKYFPAELRPRLIGKRAKIRKLGASTKTVDVDQKLAKLEDLEKTKTSDDKDVKEEPEEVEEEEEGLGEDQDEEMDDGTDYANNYFDNGEDYEDEDDNLDDGPIY